MWPMGLLLICFYFIFRQENKPLPYKNYNYFHFYMQTLTNANIILHIVHIQDEYRYFLLPGLGSIYCGGDYLKYL